MTCPGRRALLGTALALPLVARAQPAWPDRPLRLIVPFPPGGAIDAMGRLVAPHLAAALGQPCVVENRAGAGGIVGTAAAANANDGHTLLTVSIGHAVNPALYPNLPYDPAAFAAVAPLAVVPNLLAVPAAGPLRSVHGVIAAARARPGDLTYGSAGSGTSIHLAAVLFCQLAGVEMTHAPYRGSGPAVADLLAGRLDLMFDSTTSAGPHIAAGRLRALATATSRRAKAYPDLPTVAEAGLPGYAVDPWFAVLAPRSMPEAGRARAGAAITAALADPAVASRFAAIGAEPMEEDSAALERLIAAEAVKWAEVVRRGGVRPE